MLAQGAGQVQVHSMQHRNGKEIWGACSTAAGSRRRRRKKEGARAGGGLSLRTEKKKGQLDPYHYNFLKLDFMLKSMPLSGMIFNMKPNFTGVVVA